MLLKNRNFDQKSKVCAKSEFLAPNSDFSPTFDFLTFRFLTNIWILADISMFNQNFQIWQLNYFKLLERHVNYTGIEIVNFTSNVNPVCKSEKNLFFLKTSKTGSQTTMAIMHRFGIRNNLTFLIGESPNGGLSPHQEPISYENDCWIGKGTEMKFNISTQHLKYNQTLMKNLMAHGAKFFTIIREPTSHFDAVFRRVRTFVQNFAT